MAHDLRLTMDDLRREIAVRQEAEIALEVTNHELQDAITETERINQELRSFVYVASHDLREPLRKVTSFGGLLKQSLDGQLCEDDQENLDFMIDGAERMTRLIDALLVYSRVGRKEDPLTPVDLNTVLDQLRTMELAPLIEETGATVESAGPLPTVNADPVQMAQLFQNLIANGIKFRREGVAPVITIASRPATDSQTIRLEVRDNGIGIDEQYRQGIFVMFKRLHSRAKYEGTGIGLAVCKKIVERHGGTIGVEAQTDHGSVFFFTLPLASEVAATT
jgi:light-regulated signal transduction histidine kinase (bacteriophytochrome)